MKVPPEFNARLEAVSKRTGMARADVALAAVEAVIAAIERDGGIFMPVRMKVEPQEGGTGSATEPDPIARGKAIVESLAQFHASTPQIRPTTSDRKNLHLQPTR